MIKELNWQISARQFNSLNDCRLPNDCDLNRNNNSITITITITIHRGIPQF